MPIGSTEIVGVANPRLVLPEMHVMRATQPMTLPRAPGSRCWTTQRPRIEAKMIKKKVCVMMSNDVPMYS